MCDGLLDNKAFCDACKQAYADIEGTEESL